MRCVGVVLAGGQARRMGGGDKGMLPLGGSTLLDQALERLTPQVEKIVLNANGDGARFAHTGLDVLPDSIADFPGPLAGVLAGMDWAFERGASHVVSVAADTPFFPRDLVSELVGAARNDQMPIALAATLEPERGVMRQPVFGLWPVALREKLREALTNGLRKVVLFTDQHGAATAVWPSVPFDPFFNVNHPEDLVRAEALLEQQL